MSNKININGTITTLIFTSVNSSSYILFEVEILLLSLGFVTAAIFGGVLWQTKTFHRNVRVLFMNLVISAYGYAISRFYTIANDFAKDSLYQNLPTLSYFFDFTETLFAIMFSINQLGVVTERIFATIYANSYESQGYLSTVLVFIIPWIVDFATRIISNFVNVAFLSYVLLSCNLITYTVLSILYFLNKKFYKNVFKQSLSEKYQIAENIRTVRVLLIFIFITVLRNSISISNLLIRGYYAEPNKLYHLEIIMDHVMRIAIATYILLYPFPLIFAHKDLKKKYKELILRINTSSTNRITIPVNVLGHKIIMSHSGEDYFRNLQNDWNIEDSSRNQRTSRRKISNRVSHLV